MMGRRGQFGDRGSVLEATHQLIQAALHGHLHLLDYPLSTKFDGRDVGLDRVDGSN